MDHPDSQPPRPEPTSPARTPLGNLTKRDYYAVHLFQVVTANLSQNCSLQDEAPSMPSMPPPPRGRKALKRQEPLTAGQR